MDSDKGVKYYMLLIKFAEVKNGKRRPTETAAYRLPRNYWSCMYLCSDTKSISACGGRCLALCVCNHHADRRVVMARITMSTLSIV